MRFIRNPHNSSGANRIPAKSTTEKHRRIFTALLICFIIAIPLNSSYEIIAILNGTFPFDPDKTPWTIVLTPLYIKAIKDVFLGLTVLLLIASCLRSPAKRQLFFTKPFIILNMVVVVLILSAIYSFSFMPPDIVLMGIRGYWTIAFVYAGAMYWDYSERSIYPYIVAVFFLHFLIQIMERIIGAGQDVYFASRTPGLFLNPSTAGAFALLVHYFAIKFKSTPLKLLTFISLLLSNSTGGLLFLVAYYLYDYRNKMKPKVLYYPLYIVTISALCYGLIANLDELTGRGGGASASALTRLSILYLAVSNWTSLIVGMGMGIATSQAYLSGYSNAIIADNTYVGILYNAGIIPALLMLGFAFLSFRYFSNKLLAITFLGYSMTTVIFEINPVIQIMLILLGSDIGRRYAAAARDIVPRKRKSMFRRGISAAKPTDTDVVARLSQRDTNLFAQSRTQTPGASQVE